MACLDAFSGTVAIRESSRGTFLPATKGMLIPYGGAIRTGEKSSVKIIFPNGTEVFLKAETFLELRKEESDISQTSGSAIYNVKPQKESLRVFTPGGITAVLGTLFKLDVASNGTTVSLQEGKVRVTSASGESRELFPGRSQLLPATGPLPPTGQLNEPIVPAVPGTTQIRGKQGSIGGPSLSDTQLSNVPVNALPGAHLVLSHRDSQATLECPEHGRAEILGKSDLTLRDGGFVVNGGTFIATLKARADAAFGIVVPGARLEASRGRVALDINGRNGTVKVLEGSAQLFPLSDGEVASGQPVVLSSGEQLSLKSGSLGSAKRMQAPIQQSSPQTGTDVRDFSGDHDDGKYLGVSGVGIKAPGAPADAAH